LVRSFTELRSYRLAAELADELRDVVLRWERFDVWSIGVQLVRSADSVGANIAESSGRWGRPDQRRFLYIARASLYEMEHWILRASARGLLDAETFLERLTELRKTLSGQISSIGRVHARDLGSGI
jgi:four helix bundle protein